MTWKKCIFFCWTVEIKCIYFNFFICFIFLLLFLFQAYILIYIFWFLGKELCGNHWHSIVAHCYSEELLHSSWFSSILSDCNSNENTYRVPSMHLFGNYTVHSSVLNVISAGNCTHPIKYASLIFVCHIFQLCSCFFSHKVCFSHFNWKICLYKLFVHQKWQPISPKIYGFKKPKWKCVRPAGSLYLNEKLFILVNVEWTRYANTNGIQMGEYGLEWNTNSGTRIFRQRIEYRI